nr:kinesin-like protein KIN-14A [Ipomoea batatas]
MMASAFVPAREGERRGGSGGGNRGGCSYKWQSDTYALPPTRPQPSSHSASQPRHLPCSSLGVSDTMPQANLVEGTDRQRSKRSASGPPSAPVTSFSGGVEAAGIQAAFYVARANSFCFLKAYLAKSRASTDSCKCLCLRFSARIPVGEYLTSALNDFDPEQYDSLVTPCEH